MIYKHGLKEKYSPLYFLASLGSGGLAISFFMYLMFMTPHKGSPIPTYNTLVDAYMAGNPFMQGMIAVSLLGIAYFAIQHVRLLLWNFIEFFRFKKTEAYQKMRTSNAEVQLMAIPLTLAMSVNVFFILGAVFVPGLWEMREMLFPLALATFGVIGVYALAVFTRFYGRILANGDFNCEANNSLAQMLAVFAFSMIAVGFSASGAMSHDKLVSGLGILLASGFGAIAIFLAFLKVVLGFRAMFNHGVNREAAVSLWIMIPILTILGIMIFRVNHGLHENFGADHSAMGDLLLLGVLFSLQIFFGLIGHSVMKRQGYYEEFINGDGAGPVAYAAVCPGVALFVMANFLIHKGFVATGMIDKFSTVYLALYLPLIYLQFKTMFVLGKLNFKLLWWKPSVKKAVPQA